ncbi:MAG: rhodanese-like domain-containing protein [Terriglobales bacterium]
MLLSRSRLLGFAVLLIAVGVIAATLVTRRVKAAETEAAVKAASEDASQVTAGELARWIMEKRQDYQLVDLRDTWQFDDYHIPGAVNIPFAGLFQAGNLKRVEPQKKVVVYGLGAGRSAQVQLLLSMKGYRAYALEDGIIGWWDEIMTPNSIRSARPSSSGYQQARQLREYFMTNGTVSATPVAAPVMPSAPAAAAAPAKAATPVVTAPNPAAKPSAKPAKTPKPAKGEKPPAEEEDKNRLKLGVGCS